MKYGAISLIIGAISLVSAHYSLYLPYLVVYFSVYWLFSGQLDSNSTGSDWWSTVVEIHPNCRISGPFPILFLSEMATYNWSFRGALKGKLPID